MSVDITINHDPEDIRVALLAGGKSNEREISLKSADGAMGALKEAGYPVTLIDTAVSDQLEQLTSDDFDFAFICVH